MYIVWPSVLSLILSNYTKQRQCTTFAYIPQFEGRSVGYGSYRSFSPSIYGPSAKQCRP